MRCQLDVADDPHEAGRRLVVGTFGLRQKDVKSCSPINGLTAACSSTRSSGCGTCQLTDGQQRVRRRVVPDVDSGSSAMWRENRASKVGARPSRPTRIAIAGASILFDAPHEVARSTIGGQVARDHLPPGVDAGIGASARRELDRLASDERHRPCHSLNTDVWPELAENPWKSARCRKRRSELSPVNLAP
jgi:hypothetical protein